MNRKEKIITLIIFFCIMGIIMGILIYLFFQQEKNLIEIQECLKPYAIDVCEERGFEYSSNNNIFIFCKADLRSADSETFHYNETELGSCWK